MVNFKLAAFKGILKGAASFVWGKAVEKVTGYAAKALRQAIQEQPEPVADLRELGLSAQSIKTLVELRDNGYKARLSVEQLNSLWSELQNPKVKSWVYTEERQTPFARKRPLNVIVDQLIQGNPVSVGELNRLFERGGKGIFSPNFSLPRKDPRAEIGVPPYQSPLPPGAPLTGRGWLIGLLPRDLIKTIFRPVVWLAKLPVRALENIAKLPILPLILTRTVESSRWNGSFSASTITRTAIAATMYGAFLSAAFNANSNPPQPPPSSPTISQPAPTVNKQQQNFRDAFDRYMERHGRETPVQPGKPAPLSSTGHSPTLSSSWTLAMGGDNGGTEHLVQNKYPNSAATVLAASSRDIS